MSTRHLLICTEAGSNIRVLGRSFLFLRLYLGVLVEPGDLFPAGIVGAALSSVFSIANVPTVMVGTVVGAVCMGLARSSMMCRVDKVRFVVFRGRGAGHVPMDELRVVW